MASLSIIITAPEIQARLRAKVGELGATVEYTIWHQDCTIEWGVDVDDAKLQELLDWCATAGGCRIIAPPRRCT